MENEILIIFLFLMVNVLVCLCIGLLDSRNYWRKKWEDDEDFIFKFWRENDNNKK